MSISDDEVRRVAGLARLELSPEQTTLYAEHLNDILGYMEKLSEVHTAGIEPTYHAAGDINAFREDLVRPGLTRDEALANAPETDSQSIVVPRVI